MSSNSWKIASEAFVLLEEDIASGLRLYESALQTAVEEQLNLPVHLHLSVLRRRGLDDAARRIEALALARGADISHVTLKPDLDSAQAVSAYRMLVARGAVNAPMVSRLGVALSRLGDVAGLAALMDPDRLLSITDESWAGPDGRSLHEGLRVELTDIRCRAEHQGAVQSVRDLDMLRLSSDLADLPLTSMLVERIAAALRTRAETWRRSDHPLAGCVDARGEVKCWVLYSDGAGYHVPHLHHRGWLTCTYYVACDPPSGSGSAGCLVLQPPPGLAPVSSGWVCAKVAPVPGRLVVMPSFYTHSVIPLGRPGLRIVVVADLYR